MNSLVVSPKCTIPEHICCCSKLGDWTYFWVRNSFWDKTSNNWVRLDKKVRKNIPIKIDYFDSKVKKYILIKKSCSEGWICVGGGGVCIRVSFFLSLEQASYYFHQIVSKFSFCCRRLSFLTRSRCRMSMLRVIWLKKYVYEMSISRNSDETENYDIFWLWKCIYRIVNLVLLHL